jgi:putative oxidoreductase
MVRGSSVRRLFADATGLDVGLLILRLVLGAVFLGHGLQKLGWFKGGGYPSSLSEQEVFLSILGYSSTRFLAWVVTMSEVVAGIWFLLGALTPLGAAAAVGIMFQFVGGVEWGGGLLGNRTQGGFEFSLITLAGAAALAFGGPGSISIDSVRALKLDGLRYGVAALAAGTIIGAFVLIVWGAGLGGHPDLTGR